MSDSPRPYGSVWEYFRDVALAFFIVVGGFVLAGAIAAPFGDFKNLAYPAALGVGLAPFWWFARRCQIHDRDWCDYAALCVFMLLASVLQSVLPGANQLMISIPIFVVAFAAYFAVWEWTRRKLFRSK